MIAWKHRDPNPKIASFRYRALNPHLAILDAGIRSELFSPSSINLYSAVIFSKAYTNDDIALAKSLRLRGVKVVFDICDNHFYNPQLLPEYVELKDRLLEMIDISDLVVYSTEALANQIKQYCDKKYIVIPDLIFSSNSNGQSILQSWAKIFSKFKNQDKKKIVWYGIHGSPNSDSGMNDLLRVKNLLNEMGEQENIELSVVSNSLEKFKDISKKINIKMSYKEWSEPVLFKELLGCKAVIVPITPSPFTWCKSNNRVLLPLSLGVEVIADSIPSYETFRDFCFLDSWEEGLRSVCFSGKISGNNSTLLKRVIIDEFGFTAVGKFWTGALRSIGALD